MTRTLAHCGTLLLLASGCFRSSGVDAPPDSGAFDSLSIDAIVTDVNAADVSSPDSFFISDSWAPTCEAQDARSGACAGDTCNTLGPPPRVYWNGHSCEPLGCGPDGNESCEGSDCDATFATLEECQAAHIYCPSAQCRAGGGVWRFWGECDCGFACGVNGDCRACEGPSCDCGPYANFVPGEGCVPDDSCSPDPEVIPPGEKCALTGGEWGWFCTPSVCGVPSPIECDALACNCPPTMEWDDVRGCIETDACYRGAGFCNDATLCPLGTECSGGRCIPACIDG